MWCYSIYGWTLSALSRGSDACWSWLDLACSVWSYPTKTESAGTSYVLWIHQMHVRKHQSVPMRRKKPCRATVVYDCWPNWNRPKQAYLGNYMLTPIVLYLMWWVAAWNIEPASWDHAMPDAMLYTSPSSLFAYMAVTSLMSSPEIARANTCCGCSGWLSWQLQLCRI